jgi:ferredoxin/flavodoxin---NADP+ reductase
MYRILKKRDLTPVTKLFVVDAPLVTRHVKPGHFVIVRTGEAGERIPLTVADFDRDEGTVTIVVQEVGKTSAEINLLQEGDAFSDFVGPLGKEAPMAESGRIVCVGGGFGVAPIYPIAKELSKREVVEVTSIIGARTADLLILVEEMEAVSGDLRIATDDGSRGHGGFVTEVLQEMIDSGEQIDEVVAIGPMPMMRGTAEVTRPHGIQTWVSMDPIMVDGTGMCGACRVTVGGELKFACVDGPFFDAHAVDFDESTKRVKMYVEEEQLAYRRFQEGHKCRRGGVDIG